MLVFLAYCRADIAGGRWRPAAEVGEYYRKVVRNSSQDLSQMSCPAAGIVRISPWRSGFDSFDQNRVIKRPSVDKSHLSSSSCRDARRTSGHRELFDYSGACRPCPAGRGKNNPKCIRRQRVKGHVTSDNVNTWRFETTTRLTLAVCFLADENDKVLTNDKIRIADYTQQETNGALGLLS